MATSAKEIIEKIKQRSNETEEERDARCEKWEAAMAAPRIDPQDILKRLRERNRREKAESENAEQPREEKQAPVIIQDFELDSL